MNTLHILKSPPDEQVESLMAYISGENPDKLELYDAATDWYQVVDKVFTYDKVICWW